MPSYRKSINSSKAIRFSSGRRAKHSPYRHALHAVQRDMAVSPLQRRILASSLIRRIVPALAQGESAALPRSEYGERTHGYRRARL